VTDTKELVLPSKVESVDKAAVEAADFAVNQCGLTDEALFGIDMAIREAVANAVKHGNKEDESKNVEITLTNIDDGFELKVRDFGIGFAVGDVADPTREENLLKASGRGILFMRSFMDEVEWTNAPGGGTVVRMIKKR
jgi:serine/threonine-protein kinase RsbW